MNLEDATREHMGINRKTVKDRATLKAVMDQAGSGLAPNIAAHVGDEDDTLFSLLCLVSLICSYISHELDKELNPESKTDES